MRIPYRDPLPPPAIIPRSATTLPAAVAALVQFLTSPSPNGLPESTVVLSGAGLSVASGLADYRGVNGTYRVNKAYHPIYYSEFMASHTSRQRYWARSFLGWPTLHNAAPNAGHYAIRDLGRLGFVKSVITQNVDSFHSTAHPDIQTTELHGYLRAAVCTTCREEFSRDVFQHELARLNPTWDSFLHDALASGALNPDDPSKKTVLKGLRTNPDGDVDLADAPYTTFRYPPCPHCLAESPRLMRNQGLAVDVDEDGAWKDGSTAGVLKPAVVMFGENIPKRVKMAAEAAIDRAGKILVLGTSLATASAWMLARKAKERGMPIAVINLGGVRGEELFFPDPDVLRSGAHAVRVELPTDRLLPALVDELKTQSVAGDSEATRIPEPNNSEAFKDI
ncbi:related to sirtuin type 4 [Cephalotrichum gorgonifer]|uniref:Related to sirtuin type 4 n=1 Tax=Cephalotrichum gorgonifer TaxID=2041049 RepID=A0AAE8MZP6_9PEZI|nr:related to sirtuin type 4 [Cephalotrichum gorgonifer]